MKSPTVRATKDQIEEFKNSIVWKDIKRELLIWKKLCTQEYSQIVETSISSGDASNVLLHIGDVHGREKSIDYLISLPNIFLQILEDKKNDTERK
jgi:hypothetical protein